MTKFKAVGVLFLGALALFVLVVPVVRASQADTAIQLAGTLAAADTSESLTVRLARPVSSSRDQRKRLTTENLLSASWTEFPAGDIDKKYRGPDNAQLIVATNRDSSAIVCLAQIARNTKLVDGGPTPDCAKVLDAGITLPTCVTDSPDGGAADYLLPGDSREFLIAGDDCVFVRAGTNLADAQFSLLAR